MISWKSKRKRKIRNSCIGRSWRRQRRRRKKVVRKETTKSPNLTRTLDADTKAKGISNKAKVVEGIKEEDIRTKTKVAFTKDTKEEADSKVVAEEAIRVAVLEEEAVAMEVAMESSIISKVAVIAVLLQPIRLGSLIGTTTIISIII